MKTTQRLEEIWQGVRANVDGLIWTGQEDNTIYLEVAQHFPDKKVTPEEMQYIDTYKQAVVANINRLLLGIKFGTRVEVIQPGPYLGRIGGVREVLGDIRVKDKTKFKYRVGLQPPMGTPKETPEEMIELNVFGFEVSGFPSGTAVHLPKRQGPPL